MLANPINAAERGAECSTSQFIVTWQGCPGNAPSHEINCELAGDLCHRMRASYTYSQTLDSFVRPWGAHMEMFFGAAPQRVYTERQCWHFPWAPPPFATGSCKPLLSFRYCFCKNKLLQSPKMQSKSLHWTWWSIFFFIYKETICISHLRCCIFAFHGIKIAVNGKSSPTACLKNKWSISIKIHHAPHMHSDEFFLQFQRWWLGFQPVWNI